MKNLFQPEVASELIGRIGKLTTTTKGLWGKMTVAQMLAHCKAALDVAAGNTFIPRMFAGRILGPVFKANSYNDVPMRKNSPTAKEFIMTEDKDFASEKAGLEKLIQQFSVAGAGKCTTHPHSFFGKLTPDQWALSMYKHIDHHLQQFGV